MKWKNPPIAKIYESLGSVADGRVEVVGNQGKVFSSSRGKFYDVSYDPETQSIMANDNASYWKGYVGYPAIAFLLKIGVLEYREELALLLKGISWKDLNQQFKNDFDKTVEYVLANLSTKERQELIDYVADLYQKVIALKLSLLGKKVKPPQGY